MLRVQVDTLGKDKELEICSSVPEHREIQLPRLLRRRQVSHGIIDVEGQN